MFDVARRVAGVVRDQQVTFLAAAIAYYAFVSIVPLSLVALAVGSAVGGERVASAAVEAAGGVLTPTGQAVLRDALVGASGRGTATLVGTVVLLWSGLKLFRGLDAAFSQVYGVDERESLPEAVGDALTALVAIAVAVAAVVVLAGVLPALDLLPTAVAGMLSLPVVLLAAFFPVYYLFPDVDVTAREVLPGTVVLALGWTALTGVFRLYAEHAGQFELYGLLGAVLLLVTWFYLAGIVIILGAVLNAVLAGRVADGDATDDEASAAGDADAGDDEGEGPAPDIVTLDREVRALRERLEEKTVDRSDLESDLRSYVRSRVRRGHARGWGPYLVLLYGTAMTVGAYYFLSGGWAVLAMLVVWLSTLGLYVMMVLVGAGLGLAGLPGRGLDWVRERRR